MKFRIRLIPVVLVISREITQTFANFSPKITKNRENCHSQISQFRKWWNVLDSHISYYYKSINGSNINRVAKTGTRTIFHLLNVLKKRLGFNLDVPYYVRETLHDDENGIMKEINQILLAQNNANVRMRHYSFINFENFGIRWNPYWFSLIRDPIERVKIKDW